MCCLIHFLIHTHIHTLVVEAVMTKVPNGSWSLLSLVRNQLGVLCLAQEQFLIAILPVMQEDVLK